MPAKKAKKSKAKAATKLKKKAGKGKAAKSTKAAAKSHKMHTMHERKPIGKISKQMTKSQMLSAIADHAGLNKKSVAEVFDGLTKVIVGHMDGKSSPGTFNLMGLVKFTSVHKPATKAREGINPFTKEKIMIKAKPARKIVRVRALKKLKDMIAR